jgi:hypothetical protein
MENIVKINNSMNQKTTNVNTLMEDIGTESRQKATITIKGGVWKIGGEGNTFAIDASATVEQNINAIAEANAVVEHISNLTDAVLFDIANNGFSQQIADMSSAAAAASTTELEVSGIGTAAASIGVNNTVSTNVNNSIRNVFSMAVTNNMSSTTERSSLAESINSASALVKQVNNNESGIDIEGTDFNIGGEMNVVKIDAAAASGMAVTLQQTLTSNLTSSLTAITNTIASATTIVEAVQKAKSSASGSASDDHSTKLSTDKWLLIAAGGAALAFVVIAGISVYNCNKKGNNGTQTVIINNTPNKPEEEPLLQTQTTP